MPYVNEWVGDDLCNLLECTNFELYVIYDYMERHVIRRIANKHRELERRGVVKKPDRSQPFEGPEVERGRAKERREKATSGLGQSALGKTVKLVVPEEHVAYHQALQEALEDKGAVSKARFSEYQMLTKDNEGEAQIHDLKAVKFEVAFDSEPAWVPVNRVESVKLAKRERAPITSARKAVVLPDMQIPHHDERAIEVALQIIKEVKPDKIVILGDLLDLADFGRFDNLPTFAASTQEAINRAHLYLAELRKLAPSAEIVVLEGNHDLRLSTHINKNARAAYGLKRADQPENWPVLSVPYLTAMDTLDVDYVSGYPANRYWINENLQVRHGHRVKSSGGTAKLVADDERVSTIFGHVHRIETQFKTHHTYKGGKTNAAYSIGCLCKIDGSVPSAKGGVDLSGRPVENYENWQQAIAIVDYEDGDKPFNVSPVYINTFNDYQTIYNGKTYSA